MADPFLISLFSLYLIHLPLIFCIFDCREVPSLLHSSLTLPFGDKLSFFLLYSPVFCSLLLLPHSGEGCAHRGPAGWLEN